MKKTFSALLPLFGGLLFSAYATTASATLTTFQSYSGNVGLSVNGGGSYLNALPNGLTASIPAGSQVIAAYLYTSTYSLDLGPAGGSVPFATAGATFNGSNVTFTALTANPSSSIPLQAARADVTALVQAAVNPSGNAATGGTYNFAVTETNSGNQDGEVLVAVYSTPTLPTSSIGILDGAASSAGDTSSINFSGSPAGDTVLMSIGDGFSYDQGSSDQTSTIDVDGSLLTSAAGNCDSSQDGGTPPNPTYCTNGDLITAGTLGLNADGTVNTAYSNPFTPIGATDPATDHELYNISSLIDPSAGNTITLNTMNTSLDDNIFLEAFDVNGLAGFNAPPPSNGVTPEPQSLLYMGTGLAALAGMRRRFLRA
jgi:hypothetical protein